MTSRLFEPITIGEVHLPNRVVVAPMCQYSARGTPRTCWARAKAHSPSQCFLARTEGWRRIRDEIVASA